MFKAPGCLYAEDALIRVPFTPVALTRGTQGQLGLLLYTPSNTPGHLFTKYWDKSDMIWLFPASLETTDIQTSIQSKDQLSIYRDDKQLGEVSLSHNVWKPISGFVQVNMQQQHSLVHWHLIGWLIFAGPLCVKLPNRKPLIHKPWCWHTFQILKTMLYFKKKSALSIDHDANLGGASRVEWSIW